MRWFCLLLPLSLAAAAPGGITTIITSETHPPTLVNHFEQDAEPWLPKPQEDEPAGVEHDLVSVEGRGQVLRIRNAVTGGFVASQILKGSRATPVYSHLRFEYAADPNLKVNLSARVEYLDLEFGLCGPPADNGAVRWMGHPCETAADGAWHLYELPLLRYVRRIKPTSRAPKPQLISLENLHAGDYLLAGFGGNPLGASMLIDNFALYRPGPATGDFALATPRATKAEGFSVVLDREPNTTPPEQITIREKVYTARGLTAGTWYLHARAKAEEGGWGPVVHYRFEVDVEPPAVSRVSPAAGSAACPEAWRCLLTDEGVGVAPASIVVAVSQGAPRFRDEVEGEATGISEYTIQNEALEYDPVTGELALHLGRLEQPLTAGATIGVALKATDENGLALEPHRSSFRLDPAADRSAPLHPRLLLRLPGDDEAKPLPGDGTFEQGLDEWAAFGATGVIAERTDQTAAGGNYSLRLKCTENASDFTVIARRSNFDAGRFRVLSFDYKIPPRLRVDWVVRFQDAETCFIRFTDRDNDEATIIQGVPEPIADNEWHHLELPLYELLRGRYPNRTDFNVALLLLTGGPFGPSSRRFPGNYAGTEYFLDNFHLVPMLGADTRLEWAADDTVGIAGAEVVAATTPAELPAPDAAGAGRRIDGGGMALDQVKQGLVYLWARLYDPAGNLSAPLVTRFLVDAGKPRVGAVWPADGSRVAPNNLGLELVDDEGAGLDLSSIVLSVDGRDYPVDGRVLRYEPVNGRLVWDGRVGREPITFENGQTVAVRLAEARDHAGNRPDRLPSWSFTVDYGRDETGPTVLVTSRTHPAHWQETFEVEPECLLRAEPDGSATVAVGPDQRDIGQAVWITPAAGGQPFLGWLTLPAEGATYRFGMLRFDYRIPPGAQVDLLVTALDRQANPHLRAVRMTDTATDVKRIGEVPNVVADGQWHSAVIDIDTMLKADQFPIPRRISAVGLGDLGPAATPAGLAVGLDNLALLREPPSKVVRLQWTALDITGVQGYSYLFDQNSDTVPPDAVQTTETGYDHQDAPPGTSWFHIRALDGAGNWGPTTHFAVMIRPD